MPTRRFRQVLVSDAASKRFGNFTGCGPEPARPVTPMRRQQRPGPTNPFRQSVAWLAASAKTAIRACTGLHPRCRPLTGVNTGRAGYSRSDAE